MQDHFNLTKLILFAILCIGTPFIVAYAIYKARKVGKKVPPYEKLSDEELERWINNYHG